MSDRTIETRFGPITLVRVDRDGGAVITPAKVAVLRAGKVT
jgi:hypothetical protein